MNRSVQQSRHGFAAFTPLKLALAWLVFTFAIAVFGPVEYYAFPVVKTAMFLFAVMVSLTIGYAHGVNVGTVQAQPGSHGDSHLVRRIFDTAIVIALGALFLAVFDSLTAGTLNTDIEGMGEAYLEGYEGYERNTGNYSTYFIVYSLSLPFSFIAVVWGFFYFQRMGLIRRALVVLLVVGTLLFYVVGSGKQKQLGDMLIYLIAVLMVMYGVRAKPLSAKVIRRAIAGGFVALSAFITVLGQRYDVLGVDATNINRVGTDAMYLNNEHLVFALLGQDYGFGVAAFSGYLSQGYYGLGLALETDWTWTQMSGFSYSVSVLANRVLGFEWQWPNTLVYQVGVTTGWGETKWHTAFTHFATDFTWPGTVLLFGFFAYVYARCWLAAIRYSNPFAILIFALFTLGMFFMPANNQLLHSPGALFTIILASGLYLWLGRRYNGAPAPEFGTVPIGRRLVATGI